MNVNVGKGGAGLEISITAEGFDELASTLTLDNLDLVAKLKTIVRDWTKRAQRQAVQNVSGSQVVWSGGTFVINRQTGNLARSIQYSFPSPLSGVVVAAAPYAAAVEAGVPHPVDLKPFLMGKTVFIPFKTAYGNRGDRGPIAFPVQTSRYGGNSRQDPAEARKIVVTIPQYASTGRRTGNKMGIFRRVGPNTMGFIIPPRKGRPFMRAAAEAIEPGFLEAVQKAYADHVNRIGRG